MPSLLGEENWPAVDEVDEVCNLFAIEWPSEWGAEISATASAAEATGNGQRSPLRDVSSTEGGPNTPLRAPPSCTSAAKR